eukprot:gene33223-40994_t
MIQLNLPIFLNVEYSLSFAAEYPVCALQKNMVLPYPTTDSDFYSGRLFLPKYPAIARDKLVFYQGGHHGSCETVRSALVNIIKNKKLALYWGDKKREAGFQSAAFCPVPVGDSPSSKRMYDVMNFGCIPVILSDDLLWAYTTSHPMHSAPSLNNDSVESLHDTSDPLRINVTEFSLHLPQNIVQKTATHMLAHNVKGEGDVNFGRLLPSGTSLYRLLVSVAEEEAAEFKRHLTEAGELDESQPLISSVLLTSPDDHTVTKRILAANNKNKPPPAAPPGAQTEGSVNTLVRLLQKIPQSDIDALQAAVMRVAPSYRYYEFNTSLGRDAPPLTATHTMPTGGAIRQLERLLAARKRSGVVNVTQKCE